MHFGVWPVMRHLMAVSLVGLVVASLAFREASAAPLQRIADKSVVVLGPVASTCAQWLQDRQIVLEHKKDWRGLAASRVASRQLWALGYLSSTAVGMESDYLVGRSAEQITAKLDFQCKSNPQQTFLQATSEVGQDLMAKR